MNKEGALKELTRISTYWENAKRNLEILQKNSLFYDDNSETLFRVQYNSQTVRAEILASNSFRRSLCNTYYKPCFRYSLVYSYMKPSVVQPKDLILYTHLTHKEKSFFTLLGGQKIIRRRRYNLRQKKALEPIACLQKKCLLTNALIEPLKGR